jgi:redox-sensitive bicupin YhaK (pirin superfamily)
VRPSPGWIEGEVLHRDCLGKNQLTCPGQVNLMTAGRGIAHTEDSLHDGRRLHAAQLWIALPPGLQDCAPDFAHYPELPRWRQGSARLTLLAGSHGGETAPTRSHSPLVGLDIASDDGAALDLNLDPDRETDGVPCCSAR